MDISCFLQRILSRVKLLYMGFGLVTGFIGLLPVITKVTITVSLVYTPNSSLWHALSLLSVLCLHQSLLGNGSECHIYPSAFMFTSLWAADCLVAPHGCNSWPMTPSRFWQPLATTHCHRLMLSSDSELTCRRTN
jgi:hypothetical protein